MSTFVNDPDLGAQLAHLGAARAVAGAGDAWEQAADAAFLYVAHRTRYFTTDEVWRRLAEQGVTNPDEKRAMTGPVKRAKRDKVMRLVNVRGKPSCRPEAHRNPKDVYRSLVVAQNPDVCDSEYTNWEPLHDYSDCAGK